MTRPTCLILAAAVALWAHMCCCQMAAAAAEVNLTAQAASCCHQAPAPAPARKVPCKHPGSCEPCILKKAGITSKTADLAPAGAPLPSPAILASFPAMAPRRAPPRVSPISLAIPPPTLLALRCALLL